MGLQQQCQHWNLLCLHRKKLLRNQLQLQQGGQMCRNLRRSTRLKATRQAVSAAGTSVCGPMLSKRSSSTRLELNGALMLEKWYVIVTGRSSSWSQNLEAGRRDFNVRLLLFAACLQCVACSLTLFGGGVQLQSHCSRVLHYLRHRPDILCRQACFSP